MNIDECKLIEKQRRTERLQNAQAEKLIKNKPEKDLLKIAYIMTGTKVCGGSKIIFEHANYLTLRGHEIYIVCHDPKPTWFKLHEDIKFIEVPFDCVVGEYVPKDVDVIVSTTPSSIYECIEQKIAPVVYFEQGDHHLFNRAIVDSERLDFVMKEFQVCNNIFTVSNFAKEKIQEIYNKDSHVISNAVNEKIFFTNGDSKEDNDAIKITAIGGEDWEFKGIKYILEAVKELKKNYNINFTWITPTVPNTQIEKTIVNPEQMVIGDVLRNTDIYICASHYESFGLPILEAMSCGACVVTTDTGGNREFAIDGETCLIINKKDSNDIIEKVQTLINDKELKNKLVNNAFEKIKAYSWDKTIDELEKYYRNIATYSVE